MTYSKRGLSIRLTYFFVAILFFTASKIKGGNKRKKIVLCYHGVKDSQKLNFSNQIRMIKKRAFASKDFPSTNKQVADNASVCITFDDAFTNLLSNVIPVITELQIPITIFIPTGNLGTIPFWLKESEHSDSHEMVMSVNQILALNENHMVNIGSHTVDHPRLTLLKEDEIRKQLRNSLDIISELIGKKITELALPYGAYNELVIRVALEEGYQKIYTLEPVVYDAESSPDAHLIGRFSVSPDDWLVEFFLTINGAYAWLAPWRTFLSKIRR